MKRSSPEQIAAWKARSKPLQRGGSLKRKPSKPRRRPISSASPEQRAKVRNAQSITGAPGPCDPAHLASRGGAGGCDSALCVVPLTRAEHRAFDQGKLDILPALLRGGYVPEIQHALGHYEGNLLRLLKRLTGTRWEPIQREENR